MTNKILAEKLKPEMELHKSFVAIKPRKCTKYIVVHCSASQPKEDYDWKTIDQIHRQQGYITIGYHYVIKTDGTIQNGRNIDAIGAHAHGYNDESVSICLVGGVDRLGHSKTNFTSEQYKALVKLLNWLDYIYWDEKPIVLGHRDFKGVKKDCPCFDVKPFWEKYGNIYEEFDGTYNMSKTDFERYNKGAVEGDLVIAKLGQQYED